MSEPLFFLFRSHFYGLDADTQKKLFLSFRELVYRDVLFLLNDPGLAEDAIQNAFMKIIEHGPKTRTDSNMSAWLRTVARNSALDLIRKNKKYRQMFDLERVNTNEELSCAAAVEMAIDERVERAIRDEALHQAIGELSTDHRTVILLHYIMEKPYQEIVRELGITEQVLTQRLARARKKLAQLFRLKWSDGP